MSEIKPEDFTKFSLEELREMQNRFAKKFDGTHNKTPAEIEYAQKVLLGKSQDIPCAIDKLASFLKKDRLPLNQITGYDAAKYLVWQAYKSVLQIESNIETPVIRDEMKAVLQELTKWFFCIPGGEIPLNKGVYLWGNYGCGKTMLIKTFRLVLNRINDQVQIPHRVFKIAYSKDIVRERRDNERMNLNQYFRDIYCFDDLGFGQQEIKQWGNIINPIEDILHERHKRLLDIGIPTLATSNLKFDDAQSLFDARVADRMYELFFPVQLPGKSFR